MVSRLSGSPKDKELVVIETSDLTCVIKGPAEHPQYGKLRGYNSVKVEDFMQVSVPCGEFDNYTNI